MNPACKDLGYAEEDPCVIYIGIQCQDSTKCESQIELEYDSMNAKRIYAGQTKHSQMHKDSFTFYYLSLSKDEVEDVFAVLQPLTGDAYALYNIQRSSGDNQVHAEEVQSKKKLGSHLIHIKKEEI